MKYQVIIRYNIFRFPANLYHLFRVESDYFKKKLHKSCFPLKIANYLAVLPDFRQLFRIN